MAKSAVKKQTAEKKASKAKVKPETIVTEPLSAFQEPKTGRGELLAEKKMQPAKPATTKAFNIHMVKLIDGEFLSISFNRIESDATKSDDSYVNKMRPVHEDVKSAYKRLAIHWMILNDYIPILKVMDIKKYDPALIEKVFVSSVSIGGNEGEEGVKLTGYKITKRKKAVNITTPFEKFIETDELKYRHIDDLKEAVDFLFNEAHLYIGGKRGPDPQLSLDLPDSKVTPKQKE